MAGVEALLALRVLAGEGPSIELVSPSPNLVYRPERVVEPFELGEVRRFALSDIAAHNQARFTPGALTTVDAGNSRARLRDGEWLDYDALIVATGARPRDPLVGAHTFSGRGGTDEVVAALEAARAGTLRRLAFAVPRGVSWPLPLYELALLSARELEATAAELVFVTPERQPLEQFGPEASKCVRELLVQRGVALRTGVTPVAAREGLLELAGGSSLPADRAFTVPTLEGPMVLGLPTDAGGFIPGDTHGRVKGVRGVYVAGDGADFPVKQGGLATQQADAVAEAIAADLGRPGSARPFRPVLRAVLLTGSAPLFLQTSLHEERPASTVGFDSPWWPPGKIAGRYLSAYLARLDPPDAPRPRA